MERKEKHSGKRLSGCLITLSILAVFFWISLIVTAVYTVRKYEYVEDMNWKEYVSYVIQDMCNQYEDDYLCEDVYYCEDISYYGDDDLYDDEWNNVFEEDDYWNNETSEYSELEEELDDDVRYCYDCTENGKFDLDPFDSLILTFAGVNGEGTATISFKSYEWIWDDGTFSCNPCENLKNGDTVTVFYHGSDDLADDSDITFLSRTQMECTVSGLEEYYHSAKEIPTDTLENFNRISQNHIEGIFSKQWNNRIVFGNASYVGNIFLAEYNRDEQDVKTNRLYMVYHVTIKNHQNNNTVDYYTCIGYDDVSNLDIKRNPDFVYGNEPFLDSTNQFDIETYGFANMDDLEDYILNYASTVLDVVDVKEINLTTETGGQTKER